MADLNWDDSRLWRDLPYADRMQTISRFTLGWLESMELGEYPFQLA
jgi:hypothetical protein